MTRSCFLVAGPETGVGKTTVTIGLLAALRRRGLRVQPFKVGPDYIDPGFLTAAAGRAARNLDAWLLPEGTVRWLFHRHAAQVDVAAVEGMMGLFDGYSGLDDRGSSAHVARLLGLPALVVLDVSRAARSVAAVARGCQILDRRIEIVGWILNRVAGGTHLRWVREAVEQATGRPVLGHLAEDPRLRLPERHLGLVQAGEGGGLVRALPRLAQEVERRFNLDRILRLTRARRRPETGRSPLDPRQSAFHVRAARARRQPVIAWANDAAFTFHYADNVELLTLLGAQVVPWSPLRDRRLPEGAGAIVVGGGYPELFVDELARNRPMLEAIRRFAGAGGAIYGECGGLMYLSRGIIAGSHRTRLVGLVPAWVRMSPRPRVAYVEVQAARDLLLAPRGAVLRGHEFHASRLDRPLPSNAAAFHVLPHAGLAGLPHAGLAGMSPVDAGRLSPSAARRLLLSRATRHEGFAGRGILASYVHLNFLSHPPLAARLLARASAHPG